MDEPQTQQQEPSMEEILASIRRIISEDAADPSDDPGELSVSADDRSNGVPHDLPEEEDPPPALELDEDEPEEEDDDVLELTNVVEPASAPSEYAGSGGRPDDGSSLISDQTADRAQSAFARLNGSANHLYSDLPIGEGRTVEDLVRELLKPMLREWLDANLPEIVERLVDREVQHIGRGSGRR